MMNVQRFKCCFKYGKFVNQFNRKSQQIIRIRRTLCNAVVVNSNVLSRNEHEQEEHANNNKKTKDFKKVLLNGPNLKDFFQNENLKLQENDDFEEFSSPPYLEKDSKYGRQRKVFFEIHGCQMNVNDTEIIWAILKKHDFVKTDKLIEADVCLIVTCSIREGAEQKIWNRLNYIRGIRNQRLRTLKKHMKVGILGCMAERLKEKVLEKDKIVDVVAGPDSYKDLPRLLALTENNNQTAINVMLSLDETYADVMPVRLNENSISAFVSIMRGCDNMCTYCIVPFTRGRERSRPINSILDEVKILSEEGVKEITLLGQNVNSYRDIFSEESTRKQPTNLAKGFKTVYKSKLGGLRFADLLNKVAEINPEMRIRFTSPHPKDFPDEVIQVIKERNNVCKNLHLPAQSGNSEVLARMRRGYTREAYLELVSNIKRQLPEVSLSSDFICGFCGETDEEFQDTLSLMELVCYNNAYLFPYSMREKTTAHRRLKDDVPEEIKKQRLLEMIRVFRKKAEVLNRMKIGTKQLVLVEGFSKRGKQNLVGRNDGNVKVIFPAVNQEDEGEGEEKIVKKGDYIVVQINDANSQVLKGIPLYHTTLVDFYRNENNCNSLNKAYI